MERKPSYEFGHFHLDPAQKILLRNDERVSLNAKSFQILLALVEADGRLVYD